MNILVRNIRIPFDRDAEYALDRAKKKVRSIGLRETGAVVFKRSLDARRRGAICFVYTVCVTVSQTPSAQLLSRIDAVPLAQDTLLPEFGNERQDGRPVVVGFGPCGMFCALLLAENGYRPIVLERGGDTVSRAAAVRAFTDRGILDPECNIQFGAGGAGTFSDGKLMTRINDPLCHYILCRLCDFGAPAEIMTEARPHIGTDLLPGIVERVAARITELGGQIRYHTRFCGVRRSADGRVREALIEQGGIPCSVLVLAIGHSARDTYSDLSRDGLLFAPKSFSVGVRIEHLQSDIDRALYGELAGHPCLPVGEYSLSTKIGGRGVYSFCMCPGGTVAAAASEDGGVVTNGMSEYRRDGKNANSALAVSVTPEDHGGTVQSGVEFVRKIERAAYLAGGGDYCATVQTVGDFLCGGIGSEPRKVQPTYRGGAVRCAALDTVLPGFVSESLRRALPAFARTLSAFSDPEAVLTGAETRTSSPVRMPREAGGLAVGFSNLYPCGEGAGYAGGITSAAVDGLRCALTIMRRYAR